MPNSRRPEDTLSLCGTAAAVLERQLIRDLRRLCRSRGATTACKTAGITIAVKFTAIAFDLLIALVDSWTLWVMSRVIAIRGDNEAGIGASHHRGWTRRVALLHW